MAGCPGRFPQVADPCGLIGGCPAWCHPPSARPAPGLHKRLRENLMRKIASTALLLFVMSVGFGSAANAQVSINIRIGQPPAPRVVHVIPPSPGPNFVWVQGYWYPVNNRYVWHDGYWTRPHYEGQHYYYGHWDGDHGRVEHDHGWDKKKDRDYDRGHGRGRGRGHGGEK